MDYHWEPREQERDPKDKVLKIHKHVQMAKQKERTLKHDCWGEVFKSEFETYNTCT